jgi:hypothetical protein
MSGAAEGLRALLNLVRGALVVTENNVSPGLTELVVGSLGTFAYIGSTPGLITGTEAPFPSPLTVEFRGHVRVGASVPNPPPLNQLRVKAVFTRNQNPSLKSEVILSLPVEADGSYDISTKIAFLDPPASAPHVLSGRIQIDGAGNAPTRDQPFELTNARWEWFLETLGKWEAGLPAGDPLDFVASVRSRTNPAHIFSQLLGAPKKSLPPGSKPTAVKLSAASEKGVMIAGVSVRFGHVVVGIEGHPRQGRATLANLGKKLVGLDDLVRPFAGQVLTWAGDLGSALSTFLADKHHLEPGAQKPTKTLSWYLDVKASEDQLVADVDGVNLGSVYNLQHALVENLRDYYEGDSDHRFSTFLARETDTNGQPYLTVEPDGRTLTAASRAAIRQKVSQTASVLLLVRLGTKGGQFKLSEFKVNALPAAVTDALDPGSPEVAEVAARFVTSLENGLSAEP